MRDDLISALADLLELGITAKLTDDGNDVRVTGDLSRLNISLRSSLRDRRVLLVEYLRCHPEAISDALYVAKNLSVVSIPVGIAGETVTLVSGGISRTFYACSPDVVAWVYNAIETASRNPLAMPETVAGMLAVASRLSEYVCRHYWPHEIRLAFRSPRGLPAVLTVMDRPFSPDWNSPEYTRKEWEIVKHGKL